MLAILEVVGHKANTEWAYLSKIFVGMMGGRGLRVDSWWAGSVGNRQLILPLGRYMERRDYRDHPLGDTLRKTQCTLKLTREPNRRSPNVDLKNLA